MKKKVNKAAAPGCKPVFEWYGKEPGTMTQMKGKAKKEIQRG
ncbi:MAG: hypothetical protein ACE5IT_08200 [bacterium]